MSRRLEGQVALVTGAGGGIGQAIALAFAAQGAIVGVNDRKPEFTADTIRQITQAGGTAVDLAADISTRDAVHGAVDTMVDRHGRLDIIVNNAAWVRYEPIEAITEKTYDRMMAIGFGAIVWGIQAAGAAMAANGRGSIINIASGAAYLGLPNAMLYCGIKAGVTGLTRSAATDLGRKGIRVNAIAPGSTETAAAAVKLTPEKVAHRIAQTPLGRLGQVEDIANTAVFLASDDSAFITGTTLLVDGGQVIHSH